MGEVVVEVTVTNGRDLTRTKRFEALVDTGAYGLVLPLAWKDELGELEAVATVDLETADQRLIEADVWPPVRTFLRIPRSMLLRHGENTPGRMRGALQKRWSPSTKRRNARRAFLRSSWIRPNLACRSMNQSAIPSS